MKLSRLLQLHLSGQHRSSDHGAERQTVWILNRLSYPNLYCVDFIIFREDKCCNKIVTAFTAWVSTKSKFTQYRTSENKVSR